MHNPADILGLGAVLVIIQKSVIGCHTHIGENGPVTAKMLEVHKVHTVIIQKGTGTDIEIQFAAHPKVEEMLNKLKTKLNEYGNIDERMDVFNTEISQAYTHFKKAFAS